MWELTGTPVSESRIDAEVGFQQGQERSLSRAVGSVSALASIFATFSTFLITPLSWFSDSVDAFQDKILSGISTFTSLIDSLFDKLSALDDLMASNSVYQLLKYCSGADLLIPFYTDYISPVLMVVFYVLTGFLILSISLCITMVVINIFRRLISILPFFDAI